MTDIRGNQEKTILFIGVFNTLSDNGKDDVLGVTLVEELVKTGEFTESEAWSSILYALLGCLISSDKHGWYVNLKP